MSIEKLLRCRWCKTTWFVLIYTDIIPYFLREYYFIKVLWSAGRDLVFLSDFDCDTLQCPCSSLKACRSFMRSSKDNCSDVLQSNPILSRRWILASDRLYFGVCPCLTFLYEYLIVLHHFPRGWYLVFLSDFDCDTLQCPCSSLKACRSLTRLSNILVLLVLSLDPLRAAEATPWWA